MTSNLLWAHLLRKDVTTTESLPEIPPIAPQDKTGTSMRMLIHDTQVNLEKFSTRLDSLLQRVDDCRTQVVNANNLLDVERDKVLTEILEIANRCQSELKAHVGTPAQKPALDLVHVTQVSTEKSLQALEKRIDALQALLQTHVHAMQSIQDQQNTLIGAVSSLVPILHSVPSQIDQVKAVLSNTVTDAMSVMTNSVENVRSTLVTQFTHGNGRIGTESSRIGTSNGPMSNLRRRRSNALVLDQEIGVHVSSPLDGRDHRGAQHSPKRARVEGTTNCTGDARLPRKPSRITMPLANSGELPLLRTPRTPRQPLADLLLPPGSNTPTIQHHVANPVNMTSRGYMRPLETLPAAGGLPTTLTPTSMPPVQPPKHARSNLQDPMIIDRSAIGLPSAAGSSHQDALSKVIKIKEILEPNLTSVFSIRSSPLSSLLSPVLHATHRDLDETSAIMPLPSRQPHISREGDVLDAPLVELVQVPPPSSDPLSSNHDASPPKSMSLRDRRAQISRFGRSETRRFIPLAPWSDEED